MIKNNLLLFCFLFSLSAFSQSPIEKGLSSINKEKSEQYIGILASDSLEGRGAGRWGGRAASEYIKSIFEKLGIKPWGKEYFQYFDVSSGEDGWNSHRRESYRGLEMRNVLGYIEGRNTDEIVIIGAHYDHLGVVPNSTNDSIYNGADDNASGVSGVLQVAEAFLASGQQPERTIIFALWDAEEIGLIGSFHFVEDHFANLVIPRQYPQAIKGYINCDMIGRSDINRVVVYHSSNKPILRSWIEGDIEKYKLNLLPEFKSSDDMPGGSDHAPFDMKGVPYIFYFTDLHDDYHQPSDHADKINYDKVTSISKIAFLNLWEMANTAGF